jgi:signal transduction histidine kinase
MSFLKKIRWNTKLLILLIVVAIIPTTIVVFNVLGIIQDELKSTVNNQLIFSSEGIAKQIDEHYEKTFEILELAKKNILNENLGSEERINLLLSIIKSVDNIVGITISLEENNKSPQTVISAFKDSITVNNKKVPLPDISIQNDENLYRITNGKIFISNPKYISDLGFWKQIVKINLPINGNENFFMYAFLNGNEIAKYLESHPFQKNGAIFITDKDDQQVFSESINDDYTFLSADGRKMLNSSQNFAFVNNYTSPNNDEVVACFAFPAQVPWVIITGIKKASAYSIVSEIVNVFLFWLGISLVAAAIISYLFSLELSKPISKMSNAALKIAKGDFNTKISYEANDSIGTLGKSLETMSNNLDENFKEINKQRLQLEDYSKNLEKKVEERTIELVEANEEINNSYKKVVDLNKEKNEFLGIAAHDLKNPLTSIKGFTDILIQDSELPQELRQNFLEEIMGASNRMFEIVTNLLDVNAIEEGKIKINKESIPLFIIINQIIQQNNENAIKKNIVIHHQISEDDFIVQVDKNLTLQIIDNLVSNAIKFSPSDKNIYISYLTDQSDKFVKLFIKDEGQGFSEEDKKRVFGKFARLSAKPTAGENSTGLGLSIVKKLVELQKATISLESEYGKGATFILELPKGGGATMINPKKDYPLVILMLIMLLNQNLFPQQSKVQEIIWNSNANIRTIAETYLGNPNLWPVILSYNNINNISELKTGRKLFIPHEEVLGILKNFTQTEKAISIGVNNGAKIFAKSEIEEALSLFSKALNSRSTNNWKDAARFLKEVVEYAERANKKTIELRDQNADAFVSKKKGTVQNRKPNFQSWNNTSLFEKLFEQDLTRTLSSSFAEITFSDLNQIRLNENSQAVILKSKVNLLNNQTQSQVKLEKGDAYAKLFNTPKKQFNLDVAGVKTKINSDLFWVDKQDAQTKVANYKGEISLEAQGSMVTLKENQGSMIPKGKAPTPPKNLLPSPELFSPETFSKIFDSDVDLRWSPVNDANEYWVEIATDSRFASLYQIVKSITSNSYSFKSLPPNTYYWRVASVDVLGFPGKFSNHFIFSVNVDTLAPFLTVYPFDDFTVTKERQINIKIQSEKNVDLFLNSDKVQSDASGNYQTDLVLAEGLNLLEVLSVDKSGNKTVIKKEIFAELNPIVEFYDEQRNKVDDLINLTNNKKNYSGYTRAFASVKIISDKTKLGTSTFADKVGHFSVSLPNVAEDENLQMIINTRAGYTKTIKVVLNN